MHSTKLRRHSGSINCCASTCEQAAVSRQRNKSKAKLNANAPDIFCRSPKCHHREALANTYYLCERPATRLSARTQRSTKTKTKPKHTFALCKLQCVDVLQVHQEYAKLCPYPVFQVFSVQKEGLRAICLLLKHRAEILVLELRFAHMHF